MPADRRRYPPLTGAIPSPPAGCLVPGLQLPQARRPRLTQPAVCGRSRHRPRLTQPAVRGSPSPPFAGDHATVRGSPRPAVRGRSRRHPRLTQTRRAREITPPSAAHPGPPFAGDYAAGPPLTPAQVPWIKSTRHGQECHVYVLSCPQEHFNEPCLVLSAETHRGQAAPLVMAEEAIPSRLPLLSLKWKRLLRDPVRAPDILSCPEEASASELAQEGFMFLWVVLFLCV